MSAKQAKRDRQAMRRSGLVPTCDRRAIREREEALAKVARREEQLREAQRILALPEEERLALEEQKARERQESKRALQGFLGAMGMLACSLPAGMFDQSHPYRPPPYQRA